MIDLYDDYNVELAKYLADAYNCTVEEYWQWQRESELVDSGSDHWCEPDANWETV